MKKVYALLTLTGALLATGCSKSDTSPSVPAATASFTLATSIAEANEPIQLTNTSQNATRYEWRSSDAPNTINVSANPIVSFATTGSYTVTLTAYNSDNKAVTASQTVKVGKRYLKEMRVTTLNFLNGSGGAWDLDGSGPDVYLTLKPTASAAAAARTTTINNVQQTTLPLTWTPSSGSTIELSRESWTFGVLDEDAIGSDFMSGWSVDMNLVPPPARDAFGNGTYTLTNGQFTLLLLYETK